MEASKVSTKTNFKGFFKSRPTENETVPDTKLEERGSKAKGFFKLQGQHDTPVPNVCGDATTPASPVG